MIQSIFDRYVYWICLIKKDGEKELLQGLYFDEKFAEAMASHLMKSRPEDSIVLNRRSPSAKYSSRLFNISKTWLQASGGSLLEHLSNDLNTIWGSTCEQPEKPLEKSQFNFLCDGTAGLFNREDDE